MNSENVRIAIGPQDAADWLVTSAAPTFLDLIGLGQDAEHLAALPRFTGHSPSGRIKGWHGVTARLEAAEARILHATAAVDHSCTACVSPTRTAAEERCRRACNVGRKALMPSWVGVAAYRVIGEINRLAWRADGQFQPVDGLTELDAAWERADQALRERGRVVEPGGKNREAAT